VPIEIQVLAVDRHIILTIGSSTPIQIQSNLYIKGNEGNLKIVFA
jgi:hypothetical protein